MSKLYTLNCKDVGVDCEFVAQGATIEEVVEQCADHGRSQHKMVAFEPGFYIKMRRCIVVVEQTTSETSS
jgi:predicted small metal-binding protein